MAMSFVLTCSFKKVQKESSLQELVQETISLYKEQTLTEDNWDYVKKFYTTLQALDQINKI